MRENWKTYNFGDIVVFDKRFNGLGKEQKKIVSFPHVSAEELKSLKIDKGDVKLLSTGQFEGFTTEELAGDNLSQGEVISIPTGGNANLKYFNGKFVDSGNILCVPLNDSINLKFVYYSLCYKQQDIELLYRGASIKHPQMREIYKLPIKISDTNTQQFIVYELDKINELISLKKAQLSDLDALAQSIFYDMFGDPIENEKGWEVKKLEGLVKIVGGYAFKSSDFQEAGIPVLRIGNINSGEFKPINMVFWKRDVKLSRYSILPGDMVISLTGTVGKSDYGNICILDNSYEEYYLNQRNAKLEILEKLDKYYLSKVLKFNSIKSKLTNISRGVRQANISNKDIENLQIPLPPLALQQDFAKRIELIEQQKAQISATIKDLETLLASRMQYWFD